MPTSLLAKPQAGAEAEAEDRAGAGNVAGAMDRRRDACSGGGAAGAFSEVLFLLD